MARYTGSVCKLCRRQKEKLFLKGERCFSPKCAVERRSAATRWHGARRRKVSEWGLQLIEKQKARQIYGVLERQFRRYFEESKRRQGLTGENLLKILEMRLDSVVYRLGFADSRNQARQLVCHGHFALNGRKTDIPSCLVKVGDTVTWTPQGTQTEYYRDMIRGIQRKNPPSWLSLDLQILAGRVLAAPSREDADVRINEQSIVAYYSR